MTDDHGITSCFRVLYDKLITPLHSLLKNGPENHHTLELGQKFYEQSLEKTASVYNNINRFLSAFIDHVSPMSTFSSINFGIEQ